MEGERSVCWLWYGNPSVVCNAEKLGLLRLFGDHVPAEKPPGRNPFLQLHVPLTVEGSTYQKEGGVGTGVM